MVAIRGAGAVPFGTNLDPQRMVQEAVDAALADAGTDRDAIEFVVVANAAAEGLCDLGNVAVWTVDHAGLTGVPSWRVETGPSSGLAAFSAAAAMVEAGRGQPALVVGWEAMTGVPTEEATAVLGRYMSQAERRAGLSLPGLVAMLTSAYQARYDVGDEALARVPVKAHALAETNPIAQFRRPVTVEDVLASRVIAEPIRLLNCAPLTDGAVALVLDQQGPVEIAGLGAATDHLAYASRRSPPERFRATEVAAARGYQAAGWRPSDVDVVELHDAFSVLEPVSLEDLGLAEPGGGLDLLFSEEDPLAASPVVNPSGGLKARGHPVGATGLAQLYEVHMQLTDRAANQADGADKGLVHSIGGFGNNVHCALLEGTT